MTQGNLLDPDAIAKGETLGLMARRIVEGYRVGEHRSPLRGFAIEFAQHREYTTGDDIRHLDWKVLGRSDRYYIKQYEQDTNYVAHIALDGSSSMNYGSGKVTKLLYAKGLAACLAYIVLGQRDAVAAVLFGDHIAEYIPRTDNMGRIQHIMNRLAEFKAGPATDFRRTLEQLSHHTRSRGIVILISDLFGDEEGLVRGLERLTFPGNEVIVFHTLDHDELTFPFTGACRFHDMEGSAVIRTTPSDIRRSYLKSFDEYRARNRGICDKFNVHYVLADTSRSLSETLSGYLAFRKIVGRQ